MSTLPGGPPAKSKTPPAVVVAFLAGLAAGHGTSTLRQETKTAAVYADAGPAAVPVSNRLSEHPWNFGRQYDAGQFQPPTIAKQVVKAQAVYSGEHGVSARKHP